MIILFTLVAVLCVAVAVFALDVAMAAEEWKELLMFSTLFIVGIVLAMIILYKMVTLL